MTLTKAGVEEMKMIISTMTKNLKKISMNFVKVNLNTGGEIWVNINKVTKIVPTDDGLTTKVYVTDGSILRVVETPEEILKGVIN